MKLFSHNLNVLRTSWKLTQAELAQKFGVTTTSFGRWENGTEPEYDTLVSISKHFKISIDRLLTEELTPQTCPPRWSKEMPIQQEIINEEPQPSELEGLMKEVLERMDRLEQEHAQLRGLYRPKEEDT